MDCPDENILQEYLAGRLSEALAEAFSEHLLSCEDCQMLVGFLRTGVPEQTPALPFTQFRIGSMIDRYRLLRLLGAGGMGVVFAARDSHLGRKVALKVLRHNLQDDGSGQTEKLRDRLWREAQAMARLNHPNVVTIHDVSVVNDQVYLVMDLVDGGSLRDWLHEQTRTQEEILAVLGQAGAGLCAAHEAGLVHRDLKPDNILLERDPNGAVQRVAVADFGLARSLTQDTGEQGAEGEEFAEAANEGIPPTPKGRLTQTGTVMGTPGYMAPEQLLGQPADERADVFGFAATLYEALLGRRPFLSKERAALLAEMRSGVHFSPGTFGTALPKRLRQALTLGLHFDPAKRPASMAALLGLLVPPRASLGLRVVNFAGLFLMLLCPGQGSVVSPFDEGMRQLAALNYLAAEKAFVRARAIEPLSPQVHYRLSLTYQGLGRAAERRGAIQRAAALVKDLPTPLQWPIRAEQLRIEGKPAQASELYQKLVERFPQEPEYVLLWSWALYENGQQKEAQEKLEQLSKGGTLAADPRPDTLLAWVFDSAGDGHRSLATIQRAADKARRASMRYFLGEIRAAEALIHSYLGNLPEMLEAAQEAHLIAEQVGDPVRLGATKTFLLLAHLFAGDLSMAQKFGEEALLQIPEDIHLYGFLATVYCELGELAQARKTIDQGMALARRHGTAWEVDTIRRFLGVVAIGEGRMLEAKLALSGLIEEQKRNGRDRRTLATYGSRLAEALYFLGELSPAEELLRESLAIQSQGKFRHTEALSKRRLAEVLMEQGRLEEALSLAEEAATTLTQVGARDEAVLALITLTELQQKFSNDEAAETLKKAQEIAWRSEAPKVKIRMLVAQAKALSKLDLPRSQKLQLEAKTEAQRRGLPWDILGK